MRAGVVSRIVPFGIFVTVTLDSGAFADGLVHKSKIKDCGLGILGPVLQNSNGTSTVDVSMQSGCNLCKYPMTFCESVLAWLMSMNRNCFIYSRTQTVQGGHSSHISHSLGFLLPV